MSAYPAVMTVSIACSFTGSRESTHIQELRVHGLAIMRDLVSGAAR